MSNVRFIEIYSSNRNRVRYPNPSEFDVSFSSTPSNYEFKNIKFVYGQNNKIYVKNSNIIDTVTNGIIDYLWQNFYDNGILYTASNGINSQAIILSNKYTNNFNNYIGKYILILSNVLIFVAIREILTCIYTQPDPLNTFTITFDPIDFSLFNYPQDFNYTICIDYGNVLVGTKTTSIIISNLKTEYKDVIDFYVGYQINIYSNTGLYSYGIIKNYDPKKSLFTLINPINIPNLLLSNVFFTISDPSTKIQITLPEIDSCGKTLKNYQQSYNNNYIINETLSESNIVFSKIIDYDYIKRVVTLENPFPDKWSLSDQYSIRKSLPEEKMITTSLYSMQGIVTNQTNSTTIYTTGLSITSNYETFQINIPGFPVNYIISSILMQTGKVKLILQNQMVYSGLPLNFTITPLFPKYPIPNTQDPIEYYPEFLLTDKYIFLPKTANKQDNYYAGKYIYLYPNIITNNKKTSLTNIQGSCFYINSYIGNGYNVCFINNINNTEIKGATKYYPSYTNQNPDMFNIGTTINIVSLCKDNYIPINYNGSTVSQTQISAYEVSLINLTLPNQTLITGSTISYYPYVYVELSVINSLNKNIIYSNNPESEKALFLVPITDIKDKNISRFIKINSSMIETIKFKLNDYLKFSVFLPNGKLFETIMTDFYAPSLPNELIQIDALFSIKRLN